MRCSGRHARCQLKRCIPLIYHNFSRRQQKKTTPFISSDKVRGMRAPFPYFGGKSRIAEQVWARLGNTPNYVEPFAGSLAVLLARPSAPKLETVNDIDCYLSNFWRAVKHAPDDVAAWADWPVNEADLSARHLWLLQYKPLRVQGDPDYFDAKIAGWWLWGVCAWIGSGWCVGKGPWKSIDGSLTKTSSGGGVSRQLPFLGGTGPSSGQGINRVHIFETRLEYIQSLMLALTERLREVRVCCGDWSRVLGDSVTTRHGMTSVFLDPPYTTEANRCGSLYVHDSQTVGRDVFKWALENGSNPMLRIAICGYEGEYDFPSSWECLAWKAHGGFGSQGDKQGRANSHRERIWFSPACLKPSVDLSARQRFRLECAERSSV